MIKKPKSFISTDDKASENEIVHQDITDTLETNYMPYAMSVIVSRAIPEIDGFKPSHRKLLYTMYKMGLLSDNRTKSANIVGQTMRLNPHGDAAIYETMVRLSKGYDALLTPFVDSKGNFGKCYSRDMAYAASRYTEAKLSDYASEIFKDIDKDTVDFVDNYDGTMKEPVLLPTTYPNILVSSNTGIAVGMASQICGFNLNEVCQTAIQLIKHPNSDISETLLAPDFTTGGEIIYNKSEIDQVYETGRGSFKVRARYRYIPSNNVIEIYEIPYSTTVEAIIDKVADLIKSGKVREISDMRDETDLSGLKIAIDLKRGSDPDQVMTKLYKLTPLMDSYSCNFNVLLHGVPQVLGVKSILNEWIEWRQSCIQRRIAFDLKKKKDRLHLIEGLQKILLDIDKAVKLIRQTASESEVVSNLMKVFEIDEVQAEFVSEIRLRNLNKEYILNRTSDELNLRNEISNLESILKDVKKIRNIIVDELKQVIKKYPSPRKTGIVQEDEIVIDNEDEPEDYTVNLLLSNQGYIKKFHSSSLPENVKYKDGDGLHAIFYANNSEDLLVFTNKQQVYIKKISDFELTKSGSYGTYLSGCLDLDEGEIILHVVVPRSYKSNLLFVYENGRVAKVPLSVYQAKRSKLVNAFYDGSKLINLILLADEDKYVYIKSSKNKVVVFDSSIVNAKTTRNTQGVQAITLKNDSVVVDADLLSKVPLKHISRFIVSNLPAVGSTLRKEDE